MLAGMEPTPNAAVLAELGIVPICEAELWPCVPPTGEAGIDGNRTAARITASALVQMLLQEPYYDDRRKKRCQQKLDVCRVVDEHQ